LEKIINVKVSGSEIEQSTSFGGIQGEGGARYLKILFDEEWSAYSKSITFLDANLENPVKILLTTNNLDADGTYLVTIPATPLLTGGRLTYIIEGYADGTLQKSVSKELKVKYAPYVDAESLEGVITPTEADQLNLSIQSEAERIDALEESKAYLEESFSHFSESVNAQLLSKADTSYVEDELSAKADSSFVEAELSKKADTSYVEEEISKKADTSYVEEVLSAKADTSYVAQELLKKADKQSVANELSKKADNTYVESALDKKADKTELEDAVSNLDARLTNQEEYIKEYIEEKKDDMLGTNDVFAVAIKGRASGEAVSLDDTSPIEHNLTVKVRSKNLIAYPYKYNTLTTGGVTFAVGEDGGVTANGTASSAFFPLEGGWGNTDTLIPDWLQVGKTYTITDAVLLLTNRLEGKAQLALSGTFIMPEGYRTYGIFINPKDGEVLENKVYYPQLEEGAVATEYKLYSDPQDATVIRCGKNLIPYPYKYQSLTTGGVEHKVNEDGSITVNGTANGVWFALHGGWGVDTSLPVPSSFKVGKTYTITDGFALMFYDETKTLSQYYVSKTFVMPDGYSHYAVFFNPKDGAVYENRTLYPQLEEGSAATSWESPKEYKAYIPKQDGSVEGITSLAPFMTLSADKKNLVIDAVYNKDTNKVIEMLINAIISLGGNV